MIQAPDILKETAKSLAPATYLHTFSWVKSYRNSSSIVLLSYDYAIARA